MPCPPQPDLILCRMMLAACESEVMQDRLIHSFDTGPACEGLGLHTNTNHADTDAAAATAYSALALRQVM
eukprot:3674571-Rhodomonas_salina.1